MNIWEWTQQFGSPARLLTCVNSKIKNTYQKSKHSDFFWHGRCSSAWCPWKICWCLDILVAFSKNKQNWGLWESSLFTHSDWFCLSCHELLKCPNTMKSNLDITHLSDLVDKKIKILLNFPNTVFYFIVRQGQMSRGS